MNRFLLLPLLLFAAIRGAAAVGSKSVSVDAPFPLTVTEPVFPQKDFSIAKYSARADGKTDCTQAIAKAIEACSKAGGGRVVVPAGTWLTGPIHFKSNVNLYLDKGAVLAFSDEPAKYLPAVMTSWEGLECYNYSPLLYAFECQNIAITGTGTLQPKMDTWKTWFKRPPEHLNALKQLYAMAATDVPVEQRQMAENVGMENIKCGAAQRVFEVDADVLYQWKDLVPTYETKITRIDGLFMKNIACDSADAVYEIKGDNRLPVRNVTLSNVSVGKVLKFYNRVSGVENLKIEK